MFRCYASFRESNIWWFLGPMVNLPGCSFAKWWFWNPGLTLLGFWSTRKSYHLPGFAVISLLSNITKEVLSAKCQKRMSSPSGLDAYFRCIYIAFTRKGNDSHWDVPKFILELHDPQERMSLFFFETPPKKCWEILATKFLERTWQKPIIDA